MSRKLITTTPTTTPTIPPTMACTSVSSDTDLELAAHDIYVYPLIFTIHLFIDNHKLIMSAYTLQIYFHQKLSSKTKFQ